MQIIRDAVALTEQFAKQTLKKNPSYCEQIARIPTDLSEYGFYWFDNQRQLEQLKTAKFAKLPFLYGKDVDVLFSELSQIFQGVVNRVTEGFLNDHALINDFYSDYQQYKPLFKQRHGSWFSKSRFDFLITEDFQIKFVECNTSAPGGSLLQGAIRKKLRGFFLEQAGGLYKEIMLGKYTQDFAFIDYFIRDCELQPGDGVAFAYDCHGIQLELHEMATQAQRKGLHASVTDADQFCYKNGTLFLNERPIKAVYNNFFMTANPASEMSCPWQLDIALTDDEHPYHALFQAVADGACHLFIPMAAMTISEDKRIFVLLHKLLGQAFFSPEQESFIEVHIPKTFEVTGAALQAELPNLVEHKNDYVAKIPKSALGLGVFVGEETPAEHWQQLLQSQADNLTLQKRLRSYQFPFVDHAGLTTCHAVFSVYCWTDEYVGSIGRFSAGVVSNYDNGGVYPVLCVD